MTRSILKSEANSKPVSGVLIVTENKMLPFDSVALGFSDTTFSHPSFKRSKQRWQKMFRLSLQTRTTQTSGRLDPSLIHSLCFHRRRTK